MGRERSGGVMNRWLGRVGACVAAAGALLATGTTAPEAKAAEPAACLDPNPANWPPAARPYFMVVFDTSGSMNQCTNPPTDFPETCAANATKNSCGLLPTRINDGKCAFRKMVQAFSEVDFGLETFDQTIDQCGASPYSCDPYAVDGYSPEWANGCRIRWNLNGGCSGTGANAHGGLVRVGLPVTPATSANLIKWADADCGGGTELVPGGGTPINGSLRDAATYLRGQAANLTPSCRPVNVILVTDGGESCDGSPGQNRAAAAATDLWTNGLNDGTGRHVNVYPIGFGGVTGTEQTALDGIAKNGQCAAGDTACRNATSALVASNEVQLSQALASILATAIKPEKCDNVDNNCNGCTDEGFTHYCDQAQTCCAWTTDAQRTTCLNTYVATISQANPKGDQTKLPCTTPGQQTDPAHWLCFDPGDVCDNSDNNCVAGVDEGALKCGSPAHCPQAETCNGQDDNCDGNVDEGNVCTSTCAVSPTAEVCDGCDNDCNGLADDGVNVSIPCGFTGPGEPAYCQGTIACKPAQAVGKGLCVANGGYTTCQFTGTPQAETCNNLDDDCNGVIDDAVPSIDCVPTGTPGGLVYGGNSQCKKGKTQCVGGATTCIGFVGPGAEVCDGIDNDCDGTVDDAVPGTGNACGTDTGVCTKGTTACVNGVLVCSGGVQPQPETCNGLDDNCNGTVDDAPTDAPTGNNKFCWSVAGNTCNYGTTTWSPPAGATCTGVGTLSTPCSPGQLACVAGAWKCQGGKAPSTEVCNGVDDNCNTQVDESNASPALGSSCGASAGECKAGTIACVSGAIVCQGAVGPKPETCNNKDDDCNGQIDDGVLSGVGTTCAAPYDTTAYPGPRVAGQCKTGVTVCTNGTIGCAGATGPSPEVCDGKDNDCDGQIDEAGPAPEGIDGSADPLNVNQHVGDACGSAVGTCKQGALTCANGSLVCVGAVGPTPEICDGKDNDCNGQADDGTLPGLGNACGSSTPPCVKGTTACVGGALVCTGGVQPQSETCNGIDDNCNGIVDDQVSDVPANPGCWSLPGTDCSYKNAQWNAPPGANCQDIGTLTSPCAMGGLQCVGGGWKCVGDKPPSAEVCDGKDNDCNGQADEGYQSQACGSNVGECKTGMTQCSNGQITCVGGTGPATEACDGKDNNCNGIIDDGIVLGAACDPPYDTTQFPGPRQFTGECQPGTTQCDGNGSVVCVGGKAPTAEVCDGKDNDCDGKIDEDGPAPDGIDGTANPVDSTQHIGDACGSNVGACVQGHYACTNALFTCVGGKGPTPEACDCLDNDCNGIVDDDPAAPDGGGSTPICGTSQPQKTCVSYLGTCQCAPQCKGGEHPCPTGPYTCENVSESGGTTTGNFCVEDPKDLCGDCSTKTVTIGGGDAGASAVECAPASAKVDGGTVVPECVCKGQVGCHKPCYGVTCQTPLVCTDFGSKAGTCVVDNCYNVPCPNGGICNNGGCQANPCDGKTCPAGEFCKPSADFKSGTCVKSCAGVTCPQGQECKEGDCVDTGCPNGCPSGEVCVGAGDAGDAGSGCAPDKCAQDGGACANGGTCDPLSGACGNDPCEGITCPANQACKKGECTASTTDGGLDAPSDGSGGTAGAGGGSGGAAGTAGSGGSAGNAGNGAPPAEQKGFFGLATGGGGCACETGPRGTSGGPAALALLGLALAVARRRRRDRADSVRVSRGEVGR